MNAWQTSICVNRYFIQLVNILHTTYLQQGIVNAESNLCVTIHWGSSFHLCGDTLIPGVCFNIIASWATMPQNLPTLPYIIASNTQPLQTCKPQCRKIYQHYRTSSHLTHNHCKPARDAFIQQHADTAYNCKHASHNTAKFTNITVRHRI